MLVGGALCERRYNGLLRGLDSPVPFLKNDMVSLVTPKEMSEKYQGTAKKWEVANGTLPWLLT